MVEFLANHAREHGYCFETDLWNNVYLRKGKRGPVPAVCAHIDTVPTVGTGKLRQQRGRLFGVDGHGQLVGIGGDDKAGVYVCLELLERLDNLAVILFAAEEIGGLGSKNAPAAWFTDVGYLIEFDCPGQGLVSYTSGGVRLFPNDGEFIQRAAPVMEKHQLTQWQYHPFSDVMVVRQRFPISCLNVSCGYYNWHQADEYIVLAEVSAAIRSGHALIKALGCQRYPFPVNGTDNTPPRFEVTGLKVTPPRVALKPTAAELFAKEAPRPSHKSSLAADAANGRVLFGQQCRPAALEGAFESQERSGQNVRLARLDLLHRADMQINQLGQALLRHSQTHTLAAYVGTEVFQLLFLWRVKHATLGRNLNLTTTP